jgi:chemotaxis family two-component system response regulator Rcp1
MNILGTDRRSGTTWPAAGWYASGEEPLHGLPRSVPFSETLAKQEDGPLLAVLAEDNPADVYLVEEAIEHYSLRIQLHVVQDGELAANYFKSAESDQSVPCPSLLILDLNLPKLSGKEVLERVRSSVKYRNIPVLIITSSDSPAEREQLKMLGADRYFRKPNDYEQFLEIGLILRELINRPEPQQH